MDFINLKGRVAIVTGAARGMGEAIAIELARYGANVVVSDVLPGESTVKKIKALKRDSIYVKTDVSNENEVKNLIDETIKKFKRIDILVNDAGIYKNSPSLNVSEEEWERTIHVNLKGVFLCSREALKHMKRGGNIVNISSVAAMVGFPQAAAYCASKGGVRSLTKSLAAEFGNKGIRVNSIHPGVIDTPMTKGLKNSKMEKMTLLKIPLNRIGKPIDIANAVVFISSDAASYITGEELIVDGGWSSSSQ